MLGAWGLGRWAWSLDRCGLWTVDQVIRGAIHHVGRDSERCFQAPCHAAELHLTFYLSWSLRFKVQILSQEMEMVLLYYTVPDLGIMDHRRY